VLRQRTPVRVLHRRSLMERRKVVHAARTQRLGPHFFLLHLVTSAGTYVKEFVHGDLGRTRPSVGELLGEAAGGTRVAADILMLDVTGIVSGAGAEGGNVGGEEGSEDDD
jgi:tRNA pseudouridine synthase 10